MGNQQLRNLDRLCINAKLGDGYFWKHPECKNYKLIFTSTNKDLLEHKKRLCPDIFATGIRLINFKEGVDYNRYANAKPIYRLASVVHPLITEWATKTRLQAFKQADIIDLCLWYLDDGSLITVNRNRKDKVYKIKSAFICIGDLCTTEKDEYYFRELISKKFLIPVDKTGYISINGSKGTERNKIWRLPLKIRNAIMSNSGELAKIIPHKFI